MKIIIIGCPGSGKSTLAKKLALKYGIPVLHLDRIYHKDNNNHISRKELIREIHDFTLAKDKWIIDGNYISTIKTRIELADTIIFMKIPSHICLINIKQRSIEYANKKRTDMAECFDNSILSEQFMNFVKDFDEINIPEIERIFAKYPGKRIVRINNYSDLTRLL